LQVEGRKTGHVPLGAGSDPDSVVRQELSGHHHLGDPGCRERRDASGLEARRREDLLRPGDARRPRARRGRDLGLIRSPVAGDERESRAAVADEDEGLDDLRARRANRLGRRTGGRRPLRKLLDPRVDAGALEHVGDPRNRLRPGFHRETVTRNPETAIRVYRLGDDTGRRETNVNEDERRATTEALFRDVNERIAESAEHFDAGGSEFICECSDPNCTHRVPASLAEYDKVRAEPTTFIVVPGHEQDDIERVVSDRGRFRVVEKFQAAVRRTVVRLDPRNRAAPGES
jgi:hypothetical protein